jgi:hypothetical protein
MRGRNDATTTKMNKCVMNIAYYYDYYCLWCTVMMNEPNILPYILSLLVMFGYTTGSLAANYHYHSKHGQGSAAHSGSAVASYRHCHCSHLPLPRMEAWAGSSRRRPTSCDDWLVGWLVGEKMMVRRRFVSENAGRQADMQQ